jgi:hypothetical protein
MHGEVLLAVAQVPDRLDRLQRRGLGIGDLQRVSLEGVSSGVVSFGVLAGAVERGVGRAAPVPRARGRPRWWQR